MRLVVPYPPSANRYWRHVAVKGRAMVYVSPEAKAYKREVKLLHARVEPVYGNLRITATVYRPQRRGDLGNCEKVLADALEGICYHNDSQIVESHWFLRDDKANPRVEVQVDVIDGTQELFQESTPCQK